MKFIVSRTLSRAVPVKVNLNRETIISKDKKPKAMRCLIPLFLLSILIGCDNSHDGFMSISKNQYATLKIVSGDGQNGITGHLLSDSLIMNVTPINGSYKLQNFYVEPRFWGGNGSVQSPHSNLYNNFPANAKGRISVQWSLGCNTNIQRIVFELFYTDSCTNSTSGKCNAIDSVSFNATSTTPSGWNRACGPVSGGRFKTHVHPKTKQLYMVSYSRLFRWAVADAGWWEPVPGLPAVGIKDFDFTSDGKMFLSTDQDGVYTSSNLVDWESVSDGLLDPRNPLSLLVEDSVAYISYYFDGLYKLNASGPQRWKKLLIDGKFTEGYLFINRHPNGDLYLADKWSTVWVSSNSGNSWKVAPIDDKYVHGQISDMRINPIGQIFIGSGDATLSVLDPTTYAGTLRTYLEPNSAYQSVDQINFIGDDAYYFVRSTPHPGIYSSVTNWQKLEVGFDQPYDSYLFDQNNEIMVGNYSGIWYKKK